MYENQTYEKILDRMLARAGGLDTREGSLVWYAGAPAAAELQNLYIELDTVLRESFADTASRDYLVLRARERGLSPYPASSAVLALSVQPEGLTLPLGTRFSIGELNYTVTQNENGHQLTCETPGAAGSRQAGNVIPIEYVPGLESAAVAALLIPGEDEEDTESFRRRYLPRESERHPRRRRRQGYPRLERRHPPVGAAAAGRDGCLGCRSGSACPRQKLAYKGF